MRRNPRELRYFPGISQTLRPSDVSRVEALARELDDAEEAAEWAMTNEHPSADFFNARAGALAEELEALLLVAEEDEFEHAGSFQPPLVEEFAGIYADFISPRPRRFIERTTQELVSLLRYTAGDYASFRGAAVSDEELIAAAQDAYEHRRRLRRRP